MNYTKQENADMHLTLDEARGNSAEAAGCMMKGCPTAGHPVVILIISCELVHLYLCSFFFIK
jgi:hypothetical protein